MSKGDERKGVSREEAQRRVRQQRLTKLHSNRRLMDKYGHEAQNLRADELDSRPPWMSQGDWDAMIWGHTD